LASKAQKKKNRERKQKEQKKKQDTANKKRDTENKGFKDKQSAFDKKFNTQRFRAETSESGGKFPSPGDKVTTLLSREMAIKVGIQRAREQNIKIRQFEKLSKSEKQDLRRKSQSPRAPDNEMIGPGVYYRDLDDQKRVKKGFAKRIDDSIYGTTGGSSSLIVNKGDDGLAYKLTIPERLGFSEGSRLEQRTPRTTPLSAREQSYAISKGLASPFFIGALSLEAEKQLQLSQSQEDKQSKLPAIYSDDKDKELFTITGQSKGSEFSFTVPTEKKEIKDPLMKGVQNLLDFTQKEQKKYRGTNLEGRNFLLSGVAEITAVVGSLLNFGGVLFFLLFFLFSFPILFLLSFAGQSKHLSQKYCYALIRV